MRKVNKKLTQEQIDRGVIFSSRLMPNGTLHEVLDTDEDQQQTIIRLQDDSFFKNSPYKYNEIRK